MAIMLNRRAVLRGIGATLALPILECMLDSKGRLMRDGHAAGVPVPIRYLGYMIQNGVPKNIWSPLNSNNGTFTLNTGLQNLAPFKPLLNQVTGLHANGIESVFHHTDGQKGFWTGYPMHPNPGGGTDFGAGPGASISIENLLGAKLGAGKTAFQSITASLPRNHCDRYTVNQGKNSFLADSQPQSYIDTPAALAAKILGSVSTTVQTSGPDPRQVTMLDFLTAQTQRLSTKLGAVDKARLDQHLTAVREIEQQLSVVKSLCQPYAGAVPGALTGSFREIDNAAMPLMADLIVFAFKCDLTRYVLFEVANVPPPVDNPVMYVSDPVDMWDHHVSHNMEGHITSTDPLHLSVINKKMAWWALFLQKMQDSKEDGNNSILYNSVSLLGTDVSVGLDHSFDDMPLITVGAAGGALKTGQNFDFPSKPSFNNLHATLLTAVGLPTPKFGKDGTGTLPGMLA